MYGLGDVLTAWAACIRIRPPARHSVCDSQSAPSLILAGVRGECKTARDGKGCRWRMAGWGRLHLHLHGHPCLPCCVRREECLPGGQRAGSMDGEEANK